MIYKQYRFCTPYIGKKLGTHKILRIAEFLEVSLGGISGKMRWIALQINEAIFKMRRYLT